MNEAELFWKSIENTLDNYKSEDGIIFQNEDCINIFINNLIKRAKELVSILSDRKIDLNNNVKIEIIIKNKEIEVPKSENINVFKIKDFYSSFKEIIIIDKKHYFIKGNNITFGGINNPYVTSLWYYNEFLKARGDLIKK